MGAHDSQELQDLRRAVREVLYDRAAVALTEVQIARRVQDITAERPSAEQIAAVLAFLVSLPVPQVQMSRDPLGSTKYWQITAAGSLAHERSE